MNSDDLNPPTTSSEHQSPNVSSDVPTVTKPNLPVAITIKPDGSIYCNGRKFPGNGSGIRGEILQIMAQDSLGHLPRSAYLHSLIDRHVRPHNENKNLPRYITESYLRRQNNVDKAISRLRIDLARFFKDDVPPGTSWLCVSKKIDGWILFRLPGLGCDGEYHW